MEPLKLHSIGLGFKHNRQSDEITPRLQLTGPLALRLTQGSLVTPTLSLDGFDRSGARASAGVQVSLLPMSLRAFEERGFLPAPALTIEATTRRQLRATGTIEVPFLLSREVLGTISVGLSYERTSGGLGGIFGFRAFF